MCFSIYGSQIKDEYSRVGLCLGGSRQLDMFLLRMFTASKCWFHDRLSESVTSKYIPGWGVGVGVCVCVCVLCVCVCVGGGGGGWGVGVGSGYLYLQY